MAFVSSCYNTLSSSSSSFRASRSSTCSTILSRPTAIPHRDDATTRHRPPLFPTMTSSSAPTSSSSTSSSSADGPSRYDTLSAMTTIVEDTGDIEQIASHSPHSATTNPSLVAAAAADPRYSSLVEEAVRYGRLQHCSTRTEQLALTRDKLFTLFGAEIVRHLAPSAGGDVSTEVDARLSFDIDAQVAVGRRLIKMYEQESGISRDRVLIKLATTWEGIEACRILEREGIRTNMTLLFGLPQAVAAADAGAFLISPFVGRILDWYKKELNVSGFEPASEDPGVKSVREIYQYYKCFGCDTVVMGASFRNIDEIVELAGCDRLTIAPKFITMLKESYGDVERKLATPDRSACETLEKMTVTESSFRWMMNENAMATEKLAHGIRSFAEDLAKLDAQLEKILDG